MNVTAQPEAEDAGVPEARATDTRLARALAMLSGPDVRVLSLDVFDTMVWRRAPDPVDVFPIVGHRMSRVGLLAPHVTPRIFQKLRIAAEARARASRDEGGQGVEVTLRDIYAEMPPFLVNGTSPNDLAAVELTVEAELLVPDLDVIELIRAARSQGKQVVAVSDTYLSEAELRSLLEPSFTDDTAVDRVYSSSDRGVGKTSGMFEVVLEELGVAPRQLVHVGDNELSDVESPSKLGIPTVHLERRTPYLEAVLEREAVYADPDRPSVVGDAGITALRGKLLHRTELEALDPELQPFWAYGAACLGPALTGFAEWTVETTQARGYNRALCLMREGELLANLVNGAADYMGADVSAEPIWLSRHVCSRAAIVEASERELSELLVRRRPPTVRELCETVGIDVETSAALRGRADARLDDIAAVNEVIAELASDPELRATIVTGGRVLRDRVIEYLARHTDEGDTGIVLVDLGWGATIQQLLERLLLRDAAVSGKPKLVTIGLYLLTHELALHRALEGVESHGFLGSFGVPGPAARTIMRSPEILEQVCMPDVGTQVDISADLEPVLGKSVDARIPQAAHRAAVQAGIRAFQREWARYAVIAPGRKPSFASPELREQLLGQVARALAAPTGQEAALFGAWIHDENFGSHASDPLVGGPHTARAFRHMEPSDILATPMSEVYWPFGLAALEDEYLAAAAEATSMGRIAPEAFYSVVETGDFEVYYDEGFGFGELWKATLESKRNRFGLSYARTTLRGETLRGIRIDPVAAPCILRIDWIALSCSLRGQAEPVRLLFDSAESLERFTVRGAAPLRPKLFTVDGSDPQFELDLLRALGDSPYEVTVECAYAVLASPPPASDDAAPGELTRRTAASSRAVKRFVRQVENRTGVPLGQPLRRGYRRLRARFSAR